MRTGGGPEGQPETACCWAALRVARLFLLGETVHWVWGTGLKPWFPCSFESLRERLATFLKLRFFFYKLGTAMFRHCYSTCGPSSILEDQNLGSYPRVPGAELSFQQAALGTHMTPFSWDTVGTKVLRPDAQGTNASTA